MTKSKRLKNESKRLKNEIRGLFVSIFENCFMFSKIMKIRKIERTCLIPSFLLL